MLLTGTPVQNNLEEFYALLSFACAGLLGDLPTFRRLFAAPIAAARDRGATPAARRLAEERTAELARLTRPRMLQRDASINAAYLPPKTEYVVCCRASPLQRALVEALLRAPEVRAMLAGSGGGGASGLPLAAVTLLRKLCDSPDLLRAPDAAAEEEAGPPGGGGGGGGAGRALQSALLAALPPGFQPGLPASSGKLMALECLLRAIAPTPEQRIVIVAGWTSALDAVAALLSRLGIASGRLDGSVPAEGRAELVRRFNAGHLGQVFLLSTRAGGVGLNLVGACRLVLFDSDWNPAHDAQAMARVWREGQTRPVAIYRLLTAGSIEETILQRQLVKGEMAALVQRSDGPQRGGGVKRHFSAEELRSLFSWRPDVASTTAELLASHAAAAAASGGGACAGGGGGAAAWRDESGEVEDGPLRAAVAAGVVSFVQRLESQILPVKEEEEVVEEEGGAGDEPAARTGRADWDWDSEEEGLAAAVLSDGDGGKAEAAENEGGADAQGDDDSLEGVDAPARRRRRLVSSDDSDGGGDGAAGDEPKVAGGADWSYPPQGGYPPQGTVSAAAVDRGLTPEDAWGLSPEAGEQEPPGDF